MPVSHWNISSFFISVPEVPSLARGMTTPALLTSQVAVRGRGGEMV